MNENARVVWPFALLQRKSPQFQSKLRHRTFQVPRKCCFPVSDVIRPSAQARLIYHGPAWSKEDDSVVFGQNGVWMTQKFLFTVTY